MLEGWLVVSMNINDYLHLAESLPENELSTQLGIRDHFIILLNIKPEQIFPLDNLIFAHGGLYTGISDPVAEENTRDFLHTLLKNHVEKQITLPNRWNYKISDIAEYFSFFPEMVHNSFIFLKLASWRVNLSPQDASISEILREKGFFNYNFTLYSCPPDSGVLGKPFASFLQNVLFPFFIEEKIPVLFPAAYRGSLINGNLDNIPRYDPQ